MNITVNEKVTNFVDKKEVLANLQAILSMKTSTESQEMKTK